MRNLHIIRGLLLFSIITLFYYNVKLEKANSKSLIFQHSEAYNSNLKSKYEVFDNDFFSEIYLRDGSIMRFKGRLILSHSLNADYVFFRSGKAFINGKKIKPWTEIFISKEGFDKDYVSKGNYYNLVDKFSLTWGKYIQEKIPVIVKEKKVEIVKKVEVIKEIEIIKEVEKKDDSFKFPWEEIIVGGHILFFLL